MTGDELAAAEGIALTLTALCELVWLVTRGSKFPASDTARAVLRRIGTENLAENRTAAKAG